MLTGIFIPRLSKIDGLQAPAALTTFLQLISPLSVKTLFIFPYSLFYLLDVIQQTQCTKQPKKTLVTPVYYLS